MRIPIFGSFTDRNTNPTAFQSGDQQFTNCYPVVATNELAKTNHVFLVKRPGATVSANVAGSGYVSQPSSVVWTGGSGNPIVYGFASSAANKIQYWVLSTLTQVGGDISTTGTPAAYSLSETSISGVANLVSLSLDGSTQEAWFYPSGGAWTQITDSDYPSNAGYTVVGSPAHMDGYMFVMDSQGGISNSDVNSLSSWTAGNRLVANTMPDMGVGLARIKNVIAGFGRYSIEFFQNAGNSSGSILSPIGNACHRIGAIDLNSTNKRTIMTVEDTVYFMGRDAETQRVGFYKLNGFEPQKLSSNFVDELLQTASAITGVLLLHGMQHIVTDMAYNSGYLCYCIDTSFWWILNITQAPLVASIQNSMSVSSVGNERNLYTFHTGTGAVVYQDAGQSYSAVAQIGPIDNGSNNVKRWNRIDLVGDKQSTSGNTTIEYFDDDGTSPTTWGTVDMSAPPCRLRRGGSSARRFLRITDSVNRPWRVEYLDIETADKVR